MEILERAYIFWIVFSIILSFLILCANVNYLEKDLNNVIIRIHDGLIAVGITYVIILSIAVVTKQYI